MLRALLVGCAFVAAILLAIQGQWIPVVVLAAGILAHFWLFKHQRDLRQRRADQPQA